MDKTCIMPFQLDESCSAKHLIRKCRAEGECEVRDFPFRNEGKKDWEWIPILLKADAPIVTTDFTIALEDRNIRVVPQHSSGLLVIMPKRRRSGFGSHEAVPILSNFKLKFPEWNKISWRSVYAEITEVDVNVRDLTLAHKTSGNTIEMSDAEFSSKLQAAISLVQRQPELPI